MASELKSERSVLRNVFIDGCPCIFRITSVLVKTATLWMQKSRAYVQSELQEFSNMQEGSTAVEKYTPFPYFIFK